MFDPEEKIYTMAAIDRGGPILCRKDIGEVVCEYKEAFILALGIKSLMNIINHK